MQIKEDMSFLIYPLLLFENQRKKIKKDSKFY